jgi:16S rRNA (guanine527-N7)-methyltransferase
VKHRLAVLGAASGADPALLARFLGWLESDAAPTAVHDPVRAVDVHLADSLAGLAVPELADAARIADLGSGAGLPGIPIALARPAASVALVESLGRKADWLAAVVADLGLARVEVVRERAEAWTAGLGACDAVCARALAPLAVLCEYAAPLLREGGVLVAWKGAVDAAEAADGAAAAELLGLAAPVVVPVEPYPGSERRTLHVARKIAPTPGRFPRRPGMAAKRPLGIRRSRR